MVPLALELPITTVLLAVYTCLVHEAAKTSMIGMRSITDASGNIIFGIRLGPLDKGDKNQNIVTMAEAELDWMAARARLAQWEMTQLVSETWRGEVSKSDNKGSDTVDKFCNFFSPYVSFLAALLVK
jgi:hypothetical protein